MIAGPFVHSVTLVQLALALVVEFVLLGIRIIVRVVALTPLVLSILAVELEIA